MCGRNNIPSNLIEFLYYTMELLTHSFTMFLFYTLENWFSVFGGYKNGAIGRNGLNYFFYKEIARELRRLLWKFTSKKYQNFSLFSGMEILWKRRVSTWFQVNRPKLCAYAFTQNFHTGKLGDILLFSTVSYI